MSIVNVDILGHADFNGVFRKCLKGPGLEKFYGSIEAVRSTNPERTILIDVGDNISRSLWMGKDVIDGLDLIKTDVMVLGNHEFDNGETFLENTISNSNFPVLCANIFKKDDNSSVKGTKPYVIIQKDGIKIGILGLTTEYTPYMVEKSAFSKFYVGNTMEIAKKHIEEMKKQGAEIIIAATHFPFYIESESGELFNFINNTLDLGIDCYIGGHIPGDYAKVYKDKAVLKGGFGGNSLPHAVLKFDTETRRVVAKETEIINVNEDGNVTANDEISEFVKKVTGPFASFFDEVIAYNKNDLFMNLSFESPLGDFMADCVRETAKTQIAYMNSTSCGELLPAGDITRENIVNCNGFNDPIKVSEVYGRDLYQLFELVYEDERYGNNATLIFSGLIVFVNNLNDSPNRVVSITLDDGSPVIADKKYTVATSRYMASGGNDTYAFSSKYQWDEIGICMHQALFDYVRKLGNIDLPQSGRLFLCGKLKNDNAPF